MDSIPKFSKKNENVSKIKFREIVSAVNRLEKIQKMSKINFFFKIS